MPDNFRPADLVAGLRNEDESGRDRLRRFCLLPIRRLVDRIIARHRSVGARGGMVELTLGRVEMDLRSRSSGCFEGMPTRTFLAMILAVAYRMLVPPEADGALVPLLAPDDEAALGRFAAGHATEEERTRLSKAVLMHAELRRWIETVRDALEARPIFSAHAPDPSTAAEFHGWISRYHDLVERYLRLKLRDPNLADEVFQEFWTGLLTQRLAPSESRTRSLHDALWSVLNRLILDHFRARTLEPPVPETLRDEATPDADYERLWREALIRNAMARLEAYEVDTPGNYFHTVLELRRSHPTTSIEDLAAELSQETRSHVTPEAFRKTLQGARAQFLRLLIREVRETIRSSDPEEIKAEIFRLGFGHLFRRYGDFEGDDP